MKKRTKNILLVLWIIWVLAVIGGFYFLYPFPSSELGDIITYWVIPLLAIIFCPLFVYGIYCFIYDDETDQKKEE
jgi:hypothetical protein